MKELTRNVYAEDGQFDVVSCGWSVTLDVLNADEKKILEAFEYFNRPASDDLVAHKIAQLRVVLARHGESNGDISLMIETYVEHMRQYPPDIVCYAVDEFISKNKWFPVPVELIKRMDELASFRKTALKCFEGAENRLAIAQEKEVSKMSLKRSDYYSSPMTNPIRRKLCDYLISKGEPDYFDQLRMCSNYELELHAQRKGWDDGKNYSKSADENANVSKISEEILRNLSTG